MVVTYAQTHWDSALVLYRQREAWPLRPLGDAAPLQRLEQHLRLPLHVLARCPETAAREPQETPDCFVRLASLLSSPQQEIRQDAYRQAGELLIAGGPMGLGAYQALALFCPPADDRALLELYRSQPPLRPVLFGLWREQGFQVPAALYHQGELQDRDPELQQAALAYAADNPQVGPELFRAYYQPLLGTPRPVKTRPEALHAALWGGLARGDRDLTPALLRAIELAADPDQQLALLRLAALSGDEPFYPVLRSRLETDPQHGCRLLALYGRPQALDDLLNALDRAPAMEAAASSWQWLTGQRLGRKPRLSLVGGDDDDATEETMPDSAAAKAWLQQHRSSFADGSRLFQGQPMTPALLNRAADTLAGQGDADLLDLLAIHLGRPLGIRPGTWRAQRSETLTKLQKTTSAQATATAANPAGKAPRHV